MSSLALVLGLAIGAAAADPAPPPTPVPPAPKPIDPPGPLAIQGDTKVPPYRLVKLKAVNVPDKAGLLWKIRPQDPKTAATAIDWASAHNKADIRFVGPPGVYLVELSVAGPAADGSFTLDGTELTVEIQSPTPVDPPPAPTPGPTPPAPAPTGENPFGAAPGVRVMVVYDAKAAATLPFDQLKVIQGAKARDYLSAKVGDGRYVIVDKAEQFTDEPDMKAWKDALARSDRKSLPWIYVGKEAAGTSEPLPKDVDSTIALISKFAGN